MTDSTKNTVIQKVAGPLKPAMTESLQARIVVALAGAAAFADAAGMDPESRGFRALASELADKAIVPRDPSDETVRLAVRYLKQRFIGWRIPPVELPAESVIEDCVRHAIISASEEGR